MSNIRLNEYLLEITKGTTPTTIGGEFLDEGVNFIKAECLNTGRVIDKKSLSYISQDIHNKLKRSILKEEDLLFSIAGHLGKMAIVRKNDLPANTNQAVAILRIDKTKADVEFLYYYLSSKLFSKFINSQCAQSVQPNINLGQVGDLPIVEFPLAYQKKISCVLSVLDSKIELNKSIGTELESMAKTLYDYWFVQFDFPNEKGKPYKTSGGKMVWSEELKREIPEGWEVTKIGKKFKTSLGGTPSTKINEYWNNGEFYWLNSGEISNFPIIESELKITKTAIENSATSLLPKGTVMLSITRHLRPSILGVDACANQSVVGIKELGNIKCYFLYPYLVNEIPRLMEMRSGAQQPHINKEIVDESYILLPHESSKILKEYNKLVESMFDKIFNISFQTKKLVELRDWLLPILMNGQVKVN